MTHQQDVGKWSFDDNTDQWRQEDTYWRATLIRSDAPETGRNYTLNVKYIATSCDGLHTSEEEVLGCAPYGPFECHECLKRELEADMPCSCFEEAEFKLKIFLSLALTTV